MKVRILEITYRNIREMNDLTINLCQDGKLKHVSLIQMRNGYGKTTTMELLRYCLDKKAKELPEAEILSFRPPKSTAPTGFFRVKLSIEGVTKYVTLHFDYLNHKVRYTTSATEKGGEVDDVLLGEEIDSWVSTKNFVRLFIFDGELAGELLSPESPSAEEAINALYHLENLKGLYGDEGTIDHIIAKRITGINGNTKAQTSQGIRALETKLDNAKLKRRELQKKQKDIEKKMKSLSEQIERTEKEIGEHRELDERLVNEYRELEKKDVQLENQLSNLTETLITRMRNPVNFDGVSEALTKLSDQMVKVKLPKTQSMEFFDELAECVDCICGRPIGPDEKTAIKSRSKDYLSEDNIGELNAIKTDIRHIPCRENIQEVIAQIRTTNRSRMLNQRAIQKLDKKTKGKEIIEALNKKITDLKLKEQSLSEEFSKLSECRSEEQEALDLTWEDNIELCNKHIDDLEERLATATNTLAFKSKAVLLKLILEEINERSLNMLKIRILAKTNERIAKILDRSDITISKIGTYLHLSDRAKVSVGQQLSIAYAFLSTLFDEAPHSLPFIVDTPAAPLDKGVRREVSKTLPDLFEQLVVFITSGERDGFTERFYSDESNCLFLTITKDAGNMKVVNDIQYFKSYQDKGD